MAHQFKHGDIVIWQPTAFPPHRQSRVGKAYVVKTIGNVTSQLYLYRGPGIPSFAVDPNECVLAPAGTVPVAQLPAAPVQPITKPYLKFVDGKPGMVYLTKEPAVDPCTCPIKDLLSVGHTKPGCSKR